MANPILASNSKTSYPLSVNTFELPSISPAGGDVILYALFSVDSPSIATITPDDPAWELVETNYADGSTTAIFRKEVPVFAGPYHDEFTTVGSYVWSAIQYAFRSAGGAFPDNHNQDTDTYGLPGATSPTSSVALPAPPAPGNLVLGFVSIGGYGPPYTGSQLWDYAAGWDEIDHETTVGIGTAYRVADGTPDEDTFEATFDSNKISSQITFIVEDSLLEDPPPVSVGWDAYAAGDPNGPILATIQTNTAPVEGATSRGIRVELHGTGSGTLKINRSSPVALEAVLAKGNVVKCRFPWRDDYDFAFILEKGDFKLLAAQEKGAEEFAFGGRGLLAYLERAIMDAVAYTTGLDIADHFEEVWRTNKVPKPTGIAFIPTDPDFVYVIGSRTRRIYKVRQSDRKIVKTGPVLWSESSHWAAGLSGDPSDDTILWALEAPWLTGDGSDTKIRKVDRTTLAVIDTINLGSAVQLTDIRVSTGHTWTTRWDNGAIQRRNKATGAVVNNYFVTYKGNLQTQPNGVAISESGTGDEIAMWFGGTSAGGVKRALVADLSDPETVTRTLNTKDIASYGGDWSQEAGEDFFYMVSGTLSLTWKYQLTSATPHDPIDGIWRLDEATAGAILWRVIQEAQAPARPQQPLPDLTYAFTATDDTDGNDWDEHDGTLEFDAKITETVLSVALRLMPFGLVEQMSPYLSLRAVNASDYGEDRTGLAFADGVVRFEKGVNIIPELGRQDRERFLHSHMLATGKDGIYARAVLNDLGYVREGGLNTDVEDATALAGQAEAALDDERVKAERIRFAVPIGDDQADGRYLPFTHYNVGDLVTLHTGADEHDFTNETFLLYAIALEESSSGAWERAVLELGSATLVDTPPGESSGGSSSGGSGGGGGGGGTIIESQSVVVQGLDPDTGAVVTQASGKTIRSSFWQVFQAGAGIIEVALESLANRLLGLEDVDAEAIEDGQVLAYDEETGTFIPADMPTGEGDVFAIEPQVVGTARYLDRTGQWRDPLRIGNGVLTAVDDPQEITNDTKYNAWPMIHRLHDGRFLLGYTKADSHHEDNTGRAVGKIGTENADGSITWGPEFLIYDPASGFWASIMGFIVLDTGRVLVSGFQGNYSTDPLDGCYVIWSDDLVENSDAATWSDPVVVNSSLSSFSYGGNAVQLPNGDILQMVEGKNSGDTYSRMVCLRSTDRGETWGAQVAVAGDGTDRNYYEACPIVLDNDEILVMLRTTDCNGDIYTVRSTDGGLTFSAPVLAFAGHGMPNVIQSSSRTLIATTRSNDTTCGEGAVWLYTSLDRGVTWSDAYALLDETMYDSTYAGICETRTPGRYVVAYGYQPTSAVTNCDIWVDFVTEGLEVFSGEVAAEDVSVEDTEGYFAGDDVEAVLAEIGAALEAGSAPYREVLMASGVTDPPDPLISSDGTDWLYGVPPP